MNVKILAICDVEVVYTRKLMEALSERKDFVFQIHAFSTVEELEAFAGETEIEILLISGRQMSEKINQLNIGRVMLLSDGEVYDTLSEYESVYKYQSAERILKEVMCYYAEYAKPVQGIYSGKRSFEIIGIYSPLGRSGKTTFSIAAGKKYAEERKTLLLNLESYSALSGQLKVESSWNLSDMMYFLRQGKKTFLYKLNSLVHKTGKLDYILPMDSPLDIKSVSEAEWENLLDQLAVNSEYHVVMMDLGYDVNGIFELLNRCTKIYMPVPPDKISQIKMENFEKILRENDFETIIEKTQKIYLPEIIGNGTLSDFMETWAGRNIRINE